LTKSKEIAPKLCTGDLHGVDEHALRDHRPISTQTPGKSDFVQELEKVARRENRRFLHARVDLVQLTLRIASTHVIARINAKRTTQFGLESTKQKIPKNTSENHMKKKRTDSERGISGTRN
jgi:hypothetical protein